MNLVDRVVERRTEPVGAAYATLAVFHPGSTLAPLAFPDVRLSVTEILEG